MLISADDLHPSSLFKPHLNPVNHALIVGVLPFEIGNFMKTNTDNHEKNNKLADSVVFAF